MMTLMQALDELVTANRILAREGVVDSFGQKIPSASRILSIRFIAASCADETVAPPNRFSTVRTIP